MMAAHNFLQEDFGRPAYPGNLAGLSLYALLTLAIK